MLQRFSTLGRRLSAAFTEDDLMAITGNAPLIKVGNTWRVAHTPDKFSSGDFSPVATGSNLVIGNITAGTLAVLYAFHFMSSVAGLITFTKDAVVLWEVVAVALQDYGVQFSNGLVMDTTGGGFNIFNQTGVNSRLTGSCVWSEYTP